MTEKRYELRKQMKSVRWMIFWVVLAQFAAEVFVEAVVSFMPNPPHKYVQIALVEIFAIGVPISIYAKTAWNGNGKKIKQEFCLNKCSARHIVMAALLGISGQFVMMLLNIPANIISGLLFPERAVDVIPIAEHWYDILLGVFLVVILPAVLEEFWMRGIIFCAYSRLHTTAAVLFTAIMFALLHLRLNEVVGFFFMGVLASVILIKSGSIYAAMTYHAFSNLTALLFGAFIAPRIMSYIWVAFLVIALIFVLLLTILLKNKNKMQINKSFKASTIVITSIFSLPVILSVLTVIVKHFLLKVAG